MDYCAAVVIVLSQMKALTKAYYGYRFTEEAKLQCFIIPIKIGKTGMY